MKVLVIGSGGREHAMTWKLASSPRVSKLYVAPGSFAMIGLAEAVDIAPDEISRLVSFAWEKKIDLTVVGPELPLTLGIVDQFQEAGLKIVGASRRAAEIEGSKVFMKNLLARYRIPTAPFEVFNDADEAIEYVRKQNRPLVVKADGLAAGKGVVVCGSCGAAVTAIESIMKKKVFGASGDQVLIEDCLVGEETSFLALTDGENVLPLATSQDHKAVFDHDRGPNTGGMGAYSPAPVVDAALHKTIMERIMIPVVQAMKAEGREYRGVLYAGVMVVDGQPLVLEFNARFGDPEAQAIIPRLRSDLLDLLEATVDGSLNEVVPAWDRRPAVCVVAASPGYPGDYVKGNLISGLDDIAKLENTIVFHAGTVGEGNHVLTDGGRVLGVTALGKDIPQAVDRAYQAIGHLKFEGMHYRRDIGQKALKYL